jgi:queuine tRNA-ribosyltransferase
MNVSWYHCSTWITTALANHNIRIQIPSLVTYANSLVLRQPQLRQQKVSLTPNKVKINSHFKTWMNRIEREEELESKVSVAITIDPQQQQHPSCDMTGINTTYSEKPAVEVVEEVSINDTFIARRTKTKKKNQQYPFPPLQIATDFPDWSYEPRDYFRYELIHQSTKSNARVGRIHTPHGIIDTPAFVAVATNAALKGIDFQQFDAVTTQTTSTTSDDDDGVAKHSTPKSSQLIFCNTYHLMIQPGADVIGAAGGVHEFTKRRNGPFITDSGGFQVFSLAYGSVAEDLASKGELKRSKKGSKDSNNNHRGQLDGADAVQVTEDGVIFRSYRDGNKLLLTPETTVQAQKLIGADIIIPLDELPGYYVNRERLVESVARTHRWEARSLQEHLKDVKQQAMYCVIHGGMDYELRKESVDYLTSLPFDGYGIGGSLGNGRTELQELLTWLMPMFNNNKDTRVVSKPRHLLGIADEESIRNSIPHGIDTFDSCYPTRLGRHGTVLTRNGSVKLQSGIHARSFNVKIDDACTCTTCQTYDRAYLCHLFKANEPIATTLAATHNLHYMYDLMAQLRQDILDSKI